jgi:hypothetical protein
MLILENMVQVVVYEDDQDFQDMKDWLSTANRFQWRTQANGWAFIIDKSTFELFKSMYSNHFTRDDAAFFSKFK